MTTVGGPGLRLLRHSPRALHYPPPGDCILQLLEAAWVP